MRLCPQWGNRLPAGRQSSHQRSTRAVEAKPKLNCNDTAEGWWLTEYNSVMDTTVPEKGYASISSRESENDAICACCRSSVADNEDVRFSWRVSFTDGPVALCSKAFLSSDCAIFPRKRSGGVGNVAGPISAHIDRNKGCSGSFKGSGAGAVFQNGWQRTSFLLFPRMRGGQCEMEASYQAIRRRGSFARSPRMMSQNAFEMGAPPGSWSGILTS